MDGPGFGSQKKQINVSVGLYVDRRPGVKF
jgi:hypothetical protein